VRAEEAMMQRSGEGEAFISAARAQGSGTFSAEKEEDEAAAL